MYKIIKAMITLLALSIIIPIKLLGIKENGDEDE